MAGSDDSSLAENAPAVLSKQLGHKVMTTPILVVGAGGIGCELLKNLVLSGFKKITVIDLDTIDVTNLNRQFLFHRKHVGMSKSKVARESALSFVPDADITAIHGSVTTSEYGVSFYKKFAMVLNALDNRAARSHVNRMCLAADVPLVESGTAGYLGQVTVIKKSMTECYDCQEKPHQKTFPGCTIRNTPSEPIHCIVWSKHLFNQLFGESDPDEDVSPDAEDPELTEGENKPQDKDGNVARINTRQWAIENNHDPKIIFQKLFNDDIKYLLTMDKLWAKRTPPIPLDWDSLETEQNTENKVSGGIRDQETWTLKECRDKFADSVSKLRDKLKVSNYNDHLVWDKDDEEAMDFVAACSNIRSKIFGISQKTRFDIKSMAGNIIPAIATTNAVIAGCIVMEALKILNGQLERCKTVYLTRKPNPRKKILVPCELLKPNPKCYVCSEKPEVSVRLNLEKTTLRTLEDRILKGSLAMVAPDAEIEGKGIVLISSEDDGDNDSSTKDKLLKDFGLTDGSILSCDDFLQDYNVKVFLYQCDDLPEGKEFEVVGDIQKLIEAEKTEGKADEVEKTEATSAEAKSSTNGKASNGSGNEVEVVPSGDEVRKRPLTDGQTTGMPVTKKAKNICIDEDDDIICIE